MTTFTVGGKNKNFESSSVVDASLVSEMLI